MLLRLGAMARTLPKDPVGELLGRLQSLKVPTKAVSFGSTNTAFELLCELGAVAKADSQFIVRVPETASAEQLARVPNTFEYVGTPYPVLLQIVSEQTPGRFSPVRYQLAGDLKTSVSHEAVMARYRANEG